MKRKIQGWLCGLGMHDLVFVGVDRNDRIYRCNCGYRKVEPYTLSIDRIGWKQDRKPVRPFNTWLPGGWKMKRGQGLGRWWTRGGE